MNKPHLKPYIKDCPHELIGTKFNEYYSSFGTPLEYEQYVSLTKQYISQENFLSIEKEPILKKIYDDMKFLHEQLSPLYKLGIKFELELCGGAVRDFVLNRHQFIKDLDVRLNLEKSWFDNPVSSQSSYVDLKEDITRENLLDVGFSQEEINTVNFIERNNLKTDDGPYIINQLVQLCLNRNGNTLEKFLNTRKDKNLNYKRQYEQLLGKNNSILTGVIKVNNDILNYPIDILITKSTQYHFIHSFDFNFCKTSFAFVHHNWGHAFPRSHESLISRFHADFSFFADVYNKKMTVEANSKSMSSIEKTALRYHSIQNKYQEFSLNVINDPFVHEAEEQHKDHKNILIALILKYQLDHELNNKVLPKDSNKFKI